MPNATRLKQSLAGLLVASLLGGCVPHEEELTTESLRHDRYDLRPIHEEDLAKGRKHYHAGAYGLAEERFRAAIERNPNQTAAWVGLAASYDELRRFDLAERAYRRALSLNGRTALLLNNFGYHYLLQGKKSQARAILKEAARKAPDDPIIQANLELLEASPGHSSRVASHK